MHNFTIYPTKKNSSFFSHLLTYLLLFSSIILHAQQWEPMGPDYFGAPSAGQAFFAYGDSDTDHTNGITQIDAVLYTGAQGSPGGNIPAVEYLSTVYIGAVFVDGFAATHPSRTEYHLTIGEVTNEIKY